MRASSSPIVGWGLILLGVALVAWGTLFPYGNPAATVTAGAVVLGVGGTVVGRAMEKGRYLPLIVAGVVVAVVGVGLAYWGFTGSFEHDEYPAFGGIAVLAFGGLLAGLGLGSD